jgi:hypothetical protein
MAGGFFLRIEVANGAAPFDAARRVNGACAMQQCLGQRGLASTSMPDKGDSTNGCGMEFRHVFLPGFFDVILA